MLATISLYAMAWCKNISASLLPRDSKLHSHGAINRGRAVGKNKKKKYQEWKMHQAVFQNTIPLKGYPYQHKVLC